MQIRCLDSFAWAGWARPGVPLQPLWGAWGASSLWGWRGCPVSVAGWILDEMFS